MWKCPECETINDGEVCVVCGEARPAIRDIPKVRVPVKEPEVKVKYTSAPTPPPKPVIPPKSDVIFTDHEEEFKGTHEVKGSPKKYGRPSSYSYERNEFVGIIILAILILFACFELPIFTYADGFIPESNRSFYMPSALSEVGNKIMWSAVLPGIVLLIMAIAKSPGGCKWASGMGLFLLLTNLYFFVEDFGLEYVANPEKSCIAYGYWIVVIMYLISYIKAYGIKERYY